jgi:hypothetical protein
MDFLNHREGVMVFYKVLLSHDDYYLHSRAEGERQRPVIRTHSTQSDHQLTVSLLLFRFPPSRSLQALRSSSSLGSSGVRTPPPDYSSNEDVRAGGRHAPPRTAVEITAGSVTSEQPPPPLPPATDLSDVTVATTSSASAFSTPTVGVTKRGGDKSAAAAISDNIISARGGMSRRDEQQRHSFSNAVSPLHTVESSSGGGEEGKGSSSSSSTAAGTAAAGAFSRVPQYRYAKLQKKTSLKNLFFSDFNRVVTG